MKKLQLYFVILTAVCLISSCSDDTPTGPIQQEVNRITFNGGGYSNITASSVYTFAAYLQTLNLTGIEFHCIINTDTLYMIVYTPGQSSGTFNWQTANNYALLWIQPSNDMYRNGINSGTTTITSYGSTGQNIEGNFNGNVINTSPPNDTISVSCSKFSIIRSMH